MPGDRRRLYREGLRRPGALSRHRALRDRPLLDWEERVSGEPIQDVHEARLRDLRHRRDLLSAAANRHQDRRVRQIVIPDVVVDDLVVPEPLPGIRVQREDGIGEQILPRRSPP